MRKCVGFSLAILIAFATQLNAQQTGFFSGNGIKDGWGSTSESESRSDSSLFGFYKDSKIVDEEKPRFEFPKLGFPKLKAPKWEMPKMFKRENFPNPIHLSDTPGQGLFSGLPKLDLLSNHDPSQPNFFQRMNDRTKDVFGRTRDGFSNLTENSANRIRGTWDSITKGGDGAGLGSRSQPPVQPNLRSARQSDGSSSRF